MTYAPAPTADGYRTAERLCRHNRHTLVRNGRIRPRWVAGDRVGGGAFWFVEETARGLSFVRVEPHLRLREPAFDHRRVAQALRTVLNRQVDPDQLPFTTIDLGRHAVRFNVAGQRWRCGLDDYVCSAEELAESAPLEVTAPDGKHAVAWHGHNLHLRSMTGEEPRALTDDGCRDHDYGANPDYFMYSTLLSKLGIAHLPPAVCWSPDSTRVLTHRTDMAGVREVHLVDALPTGGGPPALRTQRFAHPGDEHVPRAELVVLHVGSGRLVRARTEAVPMAMMSPISRRWAWWAEDGSAVHFLRASRDNATLALQRLDPDTGEVRTLVEESGRTRVEPAQQLGQAPMVRVLTDGQVLWYSQRDNWGHLYLYGPDGVQRAQVTHGPWAVQEILHVDEQEQVVYLVGTGLVAADPYRRTVCRASLDGTAFERVTDDELDHVATVSPEEDYFVDCASTNERPPVTTVRSWSGKVLVVLAEADASALRATGWSPPQRFRATAADGSTVVHGMLYLPHGFDPARRYPVVDHPYGFPSAPRVTAAFDPGYYGADAEALAALGFVVVAIDGRGAPGRDKAFHDASYGRLQDAAGLADHVAALRELGRTRPWLDLDRVGVFGMSSGGFATVRALLDFPEFFSVGVAECGVHDLSCAEQGVTEMYQGPFDVDGYAAASSVAQAERLSGHLLLVHGGLDDSFLPYQSMRLAERLIALDRDVETLLVPSSDHAFVGYDHHLNRRRWDFLVRHLMGCEPPRGHRLAPVPLDPDSIAGLFD